MLLDGALTERVIGLAIEVHRGLGPGLLESAYEASLLRVNQAGITFERQAGIPIVYGDVRLDAGFRADIVIERILVVEMMETISAIHEAQLLTYLRLGGYQVGLLLNFNMPPPQGRAAAVYDVIPTGGSADRIAIVIARSAGTRQSPDAGGRLLRCARKDVMLRSQ